MRIHLGHHFYGAGNLGDDFMLAGFFGAMRTLAPHATFTCAVPFALDAIRRRFPQVNWQPYEPATRERCIADCDVWLGLGGSPFQHALSRWFIDHLLADAALCERAGKPMFYLGIGVQTRAETLSADVRHLAARAAGIWTRDPASAEYLLALPTPPPVESAADLAHVFFRDHPPPHAARGRVTLVPNFDYRAWPAQDSFLRVLENFPAAERVWLAQESRELPGAERALFATLPAETQKRWRLQIPDTPGTPLEKALAHWPSGEWLVTARYHAALAGAWAGSKIIVLATNEKLRAAARELHCPAVHPEADGATLTHALETATPASAGVGSAERAYAACAAFVREAGLQVSRAR